MKIFGATPLVWLRMARIAWASRGWFAKRHPRLVVRAANIGLRPLGLRLIGVRNPDRPDDIGWMVMVAR